MRFGLPYVLAAVYSAAMATWLVWFGLRIWRRAGRPLSCWLPTFSASMRAGIDRACLLGGVFHAFLCALFIGSVVTQIGPQVPHVWAVELVTSVFGIVISGYLGISIVMFNRPRFLVPPHLRDQKGTVPAWLAARRDRGAAAAYSPAAGHRGRR
jgi:hypothetical protein